MPRSKLDRAGDLAAGRPAARVAAYRLLEKSQASPCSHEVDELLAEAERQEWPEIAFMLYYCRLTLAVYSNPDVSQHLEQMMASARAAGDAALLSATLATRAEHSVTRVSLEVQDDAAERDLARAVALLDEGGGSAADRPMAYVACGRAYHWRGLWELEEEMYERASRALLVPLPAELAPIAELNRRVVLVNRLEAHTALACALVEAGDREGARELAARRPQLSERDRASLPPQWAQEQRTVEYMLAAIAGEPATVPVQHDAVLRQLGATLWPGYRACVLIGRAVRALDGGDTDQAAALAEAALPDLDYDYLPSVRTLALSLAALAAPQAPAALRYARQLSTLRWQSRLRVLGSARARLEAERLILENERLAQHAYVDELTGLSNRHAYARHLSRLRHSAPGEQVSVLMVDVDRFKSVNDTFGHAVGDDVLRRMGTLLQERIRPSDLAVRLGGDEFLVLLGGQPRGEVTRLADATRRGDDLVRAVAEHPWQELAVGLRVTISVGFASGEAGLIDHLLQTADENLYLAKTSGRGRLVHS